MSRIIRSAVEALRWQTLAIVALLAVALTHQAVAQQATSTLDEVMKRGTLVVGVKTDYPPYGFIDGNGNTVGFDIEIAKYISKKLGVGLELRPVSSANRIPMIQSRTIDLLAASLSVTRDRWAVIEFSVPYVVMGGKFLVKKGSGIKGYPDLAGKTAVFTQGAPAIAKLQKEQPAAKLLVLQDKPQALQALLQDKAVTFIDDTSNLLWFAKDHPELEVVGDSFAATPIALGFIQNDTKWRNTINFALADMWKDGSYLKAYREYFGADPEPGFSIYSWQMDN